MGIVDMTYTCDQFHNTGLSRGAVGTGAMYGGYSYGVAATVLSFSTNFYATTLVGYRAWCVPSHMPPHPYFSPIGLLREARRRLRQYIVAGPVASQMEKVFSLLVESGAIYCAFWVRLYCSAAYAALPCFHERER